MDIILCVQDIEELINEMQMRVFESQGIQGQHGIEFLGKVNTTYQADNDVMAEFLKFVTLSAHPAPPPPPPPYPPFSPWCPP